jgi:hypothetical protein
MELAIGDDYAYSRTLDCGYDRRLTIWGFTILLWRKPIRSTSVSCTGCGMKIAPAEILTPRIRLRRLRVDDFGAVARMNQNPKSDAIFSKAMECEEKPSCIPTDQGRLR